MNFLCFVFYNTLVSSGLLLGQTEDFSEYKPVLVKNFPFYVFRAGYKSVFIPSGLMGDISALSYKIVKLPDNVTAYRMVYDPSKAPFPPLGWAGFAWQGGPSNWGDSPTGAFNLTCAEALIVVARGEKGGEKVIFKVGGTSGKWGDSLDAYLKVKLTKEWREYRIDISESNRDHVITGFAVIFKRKYVPFGKQVIYLREAYFVGECK